MFKTGTFIEGSGNFSKTLWGKETSIYMKLINEMSPGRWDLLYKALKTFESIGEELDEFADSRPQHRAGRGPSSYRIQDSDPVEPSDKME